MGVRKATAMRKKAAVLAALILLLVFPAGLRAEEESLGALENGIASILAENETILSDCCSATGGAFPAAIRGRSPGELLRLGMPLPAGKEFLALPAAARAGSPLLPDLMRRLAESGYAAEGLSLFDEMLPHLSGPERSEAFFEAGRIRWERKEYGAAADAFRQVSDTSGSASEARLHLARFLAARGDLSSAAEQLSAANPSGNRSRIAGELEMLRQDPAGAVSAWAGAAPGSPGGFSARIRSLRDAEEPARASRELRAIADRNPGTFPEKVESLEALGIVLLKKGDPRASFAAAEEALSGAGRWKLDALRRASWDGSRAGAEILWKERAALFPHAEDIGSFRSAGRRFLAAALLLDTAGKAEVSAADISRSVSSAQGAFSRRRAEILESIRRSEEIRAAYIRAGQKARRISGRLRESPSPDELAAWGAREDPGIARLLGMLDEAQAKADALLGRLQEAYKANIQSRWGAPLPPEDRLTVMLHQFALYRLAERKEELRKKAAAIRAKTMDRWMAGYAAYAADRRGTAELLAKEAEAGAQRAADVVGPLKTGLRELDSRIETLGGHSARLSGNAGRLGELRARVRTAALQALHLADAELLASVARKERELHCLAGRAAAAGGPALRAEAIRNYEAALATRTEPAGSTPGRLFGTDEVLFALAELRYEEALARFRERDFRPGGTPDYAAAMSLYRRLIENFPGSPYAESAAYALAHCHQEMGNAAAAVAAMERFLDRYPESRYADDIALRLGEQHFEGRDLRKAERYYRMVRDGAAQEKKAVALFKLGWCLYLQGRPEDAVKPFLGALARSPAGAGTEPTRRDMLRLAARSLVDGGLSAAPEPLFVRWGAQAHGPSVLLEVQEILDAAGRYGEAIQSAGRLGAAYPMSAERVAAEAGAASALRKAGREEEGHVRRAGFYLLFGPGSPWQAADGRTREEIARANVVSEEGLRDALQFLHARARGRGKGDREKILSLYSAYADRFPDSPVACDVAGGNAWLLQEMGRMKEAGRVFEAAACTSDREREEVARYMALQCAKDVSSPSDSASMEEIVRLGTDYERSFPRGSRIGSVLLDRARAHFHLQEYSAAAEDARRAEAGLAERKDRIAAVRLAGESLFQAGDFAGAEAAFRSALAIPLQPEERKDVRNWIGFSRFRLAESYLPEKAGEAADLFLAIAREFPTLETAPIARFRAGASYEEAGRVPEAIDAFLPLETGEAPASLSEDATRRLVRLLERSGRHVPAAERYARLAAEEPVPPEKGKLLFRAAELFEAGGDRQAARETFSAVASVPGTPAGIRATSFFRAAENARLAGQAADADRLYAAAVSARREDPGGGSEVAGKALFRRAEYRRSREYASIPIAPPVEKSFRRKRSSLEACASLYLEAARAGDPETVAASLHRLGELLEDFRSAILATPVPRNLSPKEREEYAFLLEEKAAAMEEKAVDSYLENLYQAVEADLPSGWVESSIDRLKALRPARPDIRDIRKETP